MSSKILSSKYLSDHPYFKARVDSYQTPSGKIVDPYFVVELPPSVVVMGITKEEEVLVVKQYRHPLGEELIELPGGFIDENESPQLAAEREMLEETGYTFQHYHYLGFSAANPGVLSSYSHFFIATGGSATSHQSLDQNEEIEVLLMPIGEVKVKLLHGEFRQSLHALCLFFGFEHLDRNQ